MKRVKHVGLLALAAALAVSLTACGGSGLSKDDAVTYVTGVIEENWLGDASEEFKKLVDKTDEEVRAAYEASMDSEAEYFISNYAVEYPTDALREELRELYKEICGHTKFEVVSAAGQDDGSFSVKVTVYPIDIAHLAEEELAAALEPWREKYPAEEQDGMSEEERKAADAERARIILDTFRSKLPETDNLYAKSTAVQLERNSDGYYAITSDDLSRLSAMIIDYPPREE